jgi:Phosphatidylglycerol lysyltransferase, C-terminal
MRPFSEVQAVVGPLVDRWAWRSELTLPVIEAWHEDIQTTAAEFDGVWCLFVNYFGGGWFLYGAPLCAPDDPRAVAAFTAAMHLIERETGMAGASVYTAPAWAERLPGEGYEARSMWSEYIYDRATLASLEGTRLRSRRAEIRRFQRRIPAAVDPISAANLADCLQLVDECEARVSADDTPEEFPIPIRGAITLPSHREFKVRELRASRRYLRMVVDGKYDLRGIAMRVGGELTGFTVACPIGGNTPREAAILCEKTRRSVPGSSSYIFWWAAAHLLADFAVINSGDTFGDPGLEANKASFAPIHLREGLLLVRHVV